MKTNKSIQSRVKITASGKLIANRSGKRHLLTHKAAKRKMALRRKLVLKAPETKTYLKRLGVIG
ncbi:MAG: 50S ribosomal protein L35 [Parachlamydiales bacterium]|jgi:large subunit ribosomal protein L35